LSRSAAPWFALCAGIISAALIAAFQIANLHFPETMHQVRLVMLLLAIGGPDS
jgi:hypothetical protein